MNKLDKDYQALLQDILDNGKIKGDRTGTGTLSVFGRQIRHDMSTGFPLLTTKKMPFKTVVTELLWFLRGETHVKYLLDNNCHIWDGDLYKNYVKKSESQFIPNEDGAMTVISPASHYNFLSQEDFIKKIQTDEDFAKKWGDLGPIYGKQWRKWEYGDDKTFKNGSRYPSGEFMYDIRKEYIDQIQVLIDTLKTDPDSRRLMVNAWNVGELDKMVLPPCFTSDMLVACVDGYRKISEITTNDLVLSEDGSYQKVYDLHETKYDGDLLKIKTYGNNKSINVTPNHPFLVKDKGYINASELTLNDYLGIPINKNDIIPSFKTIIKDNQYSEKEIETILNDKDYWYLMGYFLGDGWLIESKKEIYFTINDNQVNEVLPRLTKIIGLAKLNNSGKNCKKYVGQKQQLFEVLSMFGKYAHDKIIPQFVHDAPKNLIDAFLEGYKRADGCITKDGISYTTVSESIAYGLQLLYAKLGIKASVYFQKRPDKTIIDGRTVNQRNTYSINVYKQIKKSNTYNVCGDYFWLKIKNIEETHYIGYVYNISTENNHTYNIFNLVNHNCHYGFQLYTRELTPKERWGWLRKKCWDGHTIHWDRMAIPPHEWLDKAILSNRGDINKPLITTEISVPRRTISLMWNQRSVDTFLGLPFNIASYAILLQIIADEVNMVPDELIGNLGDVHLYLNHLEQAKEQIEKTPYLLPTLRINTEFWNPEKVLGDNFGAVIKGIEIGDFSIEGYVSHPPIKADLSN